MNLSVSLLRCGCMGLTAVVLMCGCAIVSLWEAQCVSLGRDFSLSVCMRGCSSECVCMCDPVSVLTSQCTCPVCGHICSRISICLSCCMSLSTQYTWVQVCLRCIQTSRYMCMQLDLQAIAVTGSGIYVCVM